MHLFSSELYLTTDSFLSEVVQSIVDDDQSLDRVIQEYLGKKGRNSKELTSGALGRIFEVHIQILLKRAATRFSQLDIMPLYDAKPVGRYWYHNGSWSGNSFNISVRENLFTSRLIYAEYDAVTKLGDLPVIWDMALSPKHESPDFIKKKLRYIQLHFKVDTFAYVLVVLEPGYTPKVQRRYARVGITCLQLPMDKDVFIDEVKEKLRAKGIIC